jgi:uncharacterized protein
MFFDRAAQKYYHAPLMFAQAVIDSLEFARTEQTLHGNLPVSSLARLQDCLHDALGQVEVVVQGGRDAQQRPVLNLAITGALHLRCQRCLGQLDYPLRMSSTLLLVSRAEADAGDLDDVEVDWIVANRELNVAGLVEDELILSLPYAPRHAEGRCVHGGTVEPRHGKSSPFAKLAGLKKGHH